MIFNNNSKTFIIAEIGVNHNGSIKNAKRLILAAKKAGADAVKFQNFKANRLVTHKAPMANYQMKNTKSKKSQLKLLKKLELNYEDYKDLINFSKKNKIKFLTSPFDEKSYEFVKKKLKLNLIKIPSGELNNYLMLSKINLDKEKIILSTGMANKKEILDAVNTISKKKIYTLNKNNIVKNKKNLKKIKDRLFLLHCVTDYPVQSHYANLSAINTLSKNFGLTMGYSDHTLGKIAPIAAIAYGAKIIEKHFTLNKNDIGPDHKASLEPLEFGLMVEEIRTLEKMRGNGIKKLEKCESKNIKIARKSLVAKKKIKKNEIFTLSNLTTKRPGTGKSASLFFKFIGKKSIKNYSEDDLI